MAHIEEMPLEALRGCRDFRLRFKSGMEAACDVEARRKSLDDDSHPMIGQDAAGVGHAHDQSFGSCFRCPPDAQLGDAKIGLASRQPQLAQAPIPAPIHNALGGFRGKRVGCVSEKEEVGPLDFHMMLSKKPVYDSYEGRSLLLPGRQVRILLDAGVRMSSVDAAKLLSHLSY
jgi:hypothetical protein